jgi:formate dehydrogenase major subunit
MKDSTFSVQINGQEYTAAPGQTILEVAQSNESYIPSVCYHPNLGTIQTCDTCFVNANGQLVRACATKAEAGMKIDSLSKPVKDAQYEAMSRILKNHELYCTVCDNNNGNCVVHNTAEYLEIEHQAYAFEAKP